LVKEIEKKGRGGKTDRVKKVEVWKSPNNSEGKKGHQQKSTGIMEV